MGLGAIGCMTVYLPWLGVELSVCVSACVSLLSPYSTLNTPHSILSTHYSLAPSAMRSP